MDQEDTEDNINEERRESIDISRQTTRILGSKMTKMLSDLTSSDRSEGPCRVSSMSSLREMAIHSNIQQLEPSFLAVLCYVKETMEALQQNQLAMESEPDKSRVELRLERELGRLEARLAVCSVQLAGVADSPMTMATRLLLDEIEETTQMMEKAEWSLALERRNLLMEKKCQLLIKKVSLLEKLLYAEDVGMSRRESTSA